VAYSVQPTPFRVLAPESRGRAVDLRRAAQAVGVLYASIFVGRAVRLADLAAFVEVRQVARGFSGASVSACMHDARIDAPGLPRRASAKEKRRRRGVCQGIGFEEREA